MGLPRSGSPPAPVNVLFTSVGRRVELVRAFRRGYAELGLEGAIVGVDADPLAPALRECDEALMVPRLDEPHYVSTLVELCAQWRVALLFALIDTEIPLLAQHRDELEATGARPMVVAGDAAQVTADKLATAELFERLGVPAPACWQGEAARDGDLPFPAFVKPRFGSAGAHAHTVADREELAFWLPRVPEPIVQEHLPGPEITTDVLCLEEGEVAAAVSRRRLEVRTGEVAKGVTVRDERILEHCASIARELRVRGPITVQCLMRDEEPCFTEVNPRFGGGLPLALAAGMHAPRWLLAHAAGMEVELPPVGGYEVGLYMTRYDESFFLTEEHRAALAGHRL
jgi:carbamoyl-phosphate synthase large subunit